jgi:polysaccharide export outer membrane protein
MRSLNAGVFSVPPCLCARKLWVGSLAIAMALPFLPAVAAQVSSKGSGNAAAASLSLPQVNPASAANERIKQLTLTQTSQKTDYVLDSGDLLGVEVFDVQELTRDVRVSESGLISLPLLPVKIRAAGLTAFQLQDKLAELLLANGLVSNPQVTVSVKEQHGQPITVMGAVKTPMVIQAVRQMTLVEVLSRAGGIAEDAAGQILVTHAVPALPEVAAVAGSDASESTTASAEPESQVTFDPLITRVSLTDLLDSGDPKYNLVLRGGDVISVPRAGVVYAVGAVARPGGFVMASDRQQLTVLKVLALSGGLTSTAKKKGAVIIRQSADADKRQVPIDLDRILAFKTEDPLLLQSDILFVPNSSGKQAMGRVAQSALGLASGVALVRLGGL